MDKGMTPRERIMAALRRQPHDRVPTGGSLWSGLQPDLIDLDYTWDEAFHDPEKLFRIAQRPYTIYGYDHLTIPMDMRNEAEAYGCKVSYNLKTTRGMRLGMVTDWVVHTEKDLKNLKIFNPKKAPRMAMILEVVSKLRATFPEVAIFGQVNGVGDCHTDVVNDVEMFPGDSNGHFRTFFKNISEHPKLVHQVNEILAEGAIVWGKALMEAGCDAIVSHECVGWLGMQPDQYEEFITQYHSKVVKGIGAPYIFNECAAGPFLHLMVATGATCCHVPVTVDLKEAGEKYGNKVCLMGNLACHNPGDILSAGTWERVKETAKSCIETGKTMPGFILAPECEIHFGVPRENIRAISEAAKEFGSRV